MCPFLPDSPRLLIRKGKYDEAREVIAALQGDGATPEDPRVKTQFNVIKDILDREHMNTYSWWKLLSGRGPSGVLRRMILGAWMQAMNQISGINVTSYYMTSIYNIGCFIGAMSTIFTGDKLGRPRQVMLGTFVIGIGAIIQTASYTVAQMMVGRIVAGLGTGANTATAGVWQAETSKMNSRGKLVIIQMANCITGFSLSNWLTLGFSFAPGSVDWRFPIAFQLFFVIVLFAMCPFLPDSPRLLIRKGKYDEAREVIAALQGDGATPEDPRVKTQFNVIKDILDREHMNTYSWWKLLSGRGPSGVLRRMILGAWMQAMNQISGINVTSYYMSYIFINALGISELLSRILAACGSVDYLIFASLAYFVIERYGRRKVMMCSAAACSMCWIGITIAMGISEHGGNSYVCGSIAVAFFFLFFASFGMGVLGIPWLYPAEINALEMRTKGASLAMATNWICNYAVVQATLPGVENLGYKFWIVWACICFAFIPI